MLWKLWTFLGVTFILSLSNSIIVKIADKLGYHTHAFRFKKQSFFLSTFNGDNLVFALKKITSKFP